ncbi:MAG TPA: tRNA lysidine(34) synthetase TilS, partial [Hyphomonas sp.]|nr:tRNA lysidine(34) synthetase TilS [Hyphomonas sp.]
MHLASGWARLRGAMLLVLTVDHGLRAEAAQEAAFVAAAARGLNLEHQTLR